jgi:hypothetical protein
MNGFITESASKLTDGIGNTIKLLLLYFITTLAVFPAVYIFHRAGSLIYILLLLALAVFELQRSLAVRTSDQRRAWNGMAAGVYFWQVIRYSAQMGSLQVFQQAGIIFWVMAVLITATLWKKVLPVGVRTAMLVILVCWLGKIYVVGLDYLVNWAPVIVFGYKALRYIFGAGSLIPLFYILFRSDNSSSRSYAAILFFTGLLFLFLLF